MPARPAIGIVRVSQTAGREGDSFASPVEQRQRIEAACERDNLKLIQTIEELDVSGGTPLAERAGLRRAVERVEAGEAKVIVAAYFDRLMRSTAVQAELVERVEQAGGRVFAADVGPVTNGSAGQWLSGTMLGAVSEYQRRTAKERSAEAQARAVARGVLPFPNVPPGYQRGEGGGLEIEPTEAPIVVEAFKMRANGATVAEVRSHLARNGIARSYHGIGSMLASRLYLGEIHFGELVNLAAHEAIIDRDLWRAVQRVRVSRGRRAKSDRLLARLGVLRCGSCGGRMSVGTQTQGGRRYPFYRCRPTGDCTRRMAISAELVEGIVVDKVRAALADAEGRASIADNARQAEAEREAAQANLDAAIRAFDGLADEPAAKDRLAELRAIRDGAQERVDHLGSPAEVVVTAADWDRLSLDERRALIRATVERVLVAPGRGAGRVSVELVGE